MLRVGLGDPLLHLLLKQRRLRFTAQPVQLPSTFCGFGRERSPRPHGLDLIPRRTCEAVAVMGDRKRVRVVYSIIEANGFAGYGTGVTFCVTGYDRNLAHGSACDRLPGR